MARAPAGSPTHCRRRPSWSLQNDGGAGRRGLEAEQRAGDGRALAGGGVPVAAAGDVAGGEDVGERGAAALAGPDRLPGPSRRSHSVAGRTPTRDDARGPSRGASRRRARTPRRGVPPRPRLIRSAPSAAPRAAAAAARTRRRRAAGRRRPRGAMRPGARPTSAPEQAAEGQRGGLDDGHRRAEAAGAGGDLEPDQPAADHASPRRRRSAPPAAARASASVRRVWTLAKPASAGSIAGRCPWRSAGRRSAGARRRPARPSARPGQAHRGRAEAQLDAVVRVPLARPEARVGGASVRPSLESGGRS